MNNQEFYKLFKNSKLAQVATPLSKKLRGPNTSAPTHQIIYTPTASAARSNFGIKTSLPKQIGQSHIVFNDIDNFKNMPDVEKHAGPHYTRLKFQESGIVLKKAYKKSNPLFAWNSSKTFAKEASTTDSVLSKFNLGQDSDISEVKDLIKRNPDLRAEFKKWLVVNSPESVMLKVPSKLEQLLKDFIASSPTLVKREKSLADMTRNRGVVSSHAPKSHIQGTAGLSYLQNGRLTNTPNGVKQGVIAPGRIVREREAAIGGIIAAVNERTTLLQSNYIKNAPGKHSRQFVMPFKVNEAELTPTGGVRLHADGVKVGSWIQRSDNYSNGSNYIASNPNFGTMSERNSKDSSALESLLGLVSKSRV
ncbi:putative 37S ribosomal protein [Clavispora lusitaniae]|uniref:37S ribosomal protein n=3 Tax=Clavispora lusitaniae TaxID=36911 RepID=C4XVQ7_CLAL4|nr:uncharacterized protein CLUG_00042 [Clavispora lusitaniae ATCC 42720]KAF5213528.1 mitochondrial ribosomal small subunit component [Clavispora lusitaniae]EEQ35919.1 hypothetical protein CLUG_00042 [Clavispora lusitaniae ATCC 42720]KAF7583974.1 Mitochondrial ribosomal protein subunit family protein [Clavispora lusitaniae]OVF06658.1 putative mitochondrial 37S ribosomal protein [Clavispora lusitaniae]QFZ24968.1 putative 37S ribosomal protein [Clavispora lusitaniae]